ncbi:hypothetical protein [Arenimonas sp.]|uniref:COG3904 family protein n=1 Tax=Arenimonas sp. TaxID=1872635 RepID=UPI0039E35FFA
MIRLRHFAPALLAVLALTACQPEPPPPPKKKTPTQIVESDTLEGGAISTAPVRNGSAPYAAVSRQNARIDWSPMTLPEEDQAWLSCELDYETKGDGAPLASLDRKALTAALQTCREPGVLRLRYHGHIGADFTALIERVTRLADELDIDKRVLDIDSTGGQVEDAIRAGDFIAESRWTIWVREGSQCHSACVFILSAGDTRRIAGRVGIHRIIRMSSTASTRAELNAELRVVYDRVRAYLERNGAAVAVADLMMAVPNRSLRLLTADELKRYGLDGANPAQDDLDRLRLMRKCGEDFVNRRDAFVLAFDRRCRGSQDQLGGLNDCGLDLRKDFGFPDRTCPAESPLAEFDRAQTSASGEAADGQSAGKPAP